MFSLELHNKFSVGLAVDRAWALLTDLRQIAPSMPGANSSRRAVLQAEGRDTRGQGNAAALITAHLEPDVDRTRVTGKVAQFGRGALTDVSTKLLWLLGRRRRSH